MIMSNLNDVREHMLQEVDKDIKRKKLKKGKYLSKRGEKLIKMRGEIFSKYKEVLEYIHKLSKVILPVLNKYYIGENKEQIISEVSKWS